MMRWLAALALLLTVASVQAAPSVVPGAPTAIHGAADGKVPAWIIDTRLPAGWKADCCTYAAAIGVNFVAYQGEWTGDPNRVMVLNVWPTKLATLADETAADRKHYLQSDPKAKASHFAIDQPTMRCEADSFEGSDHLDDIVVFCDPGKAAGIRLSWSMTLAAHDPQRKQMLADLMAVVMASRYHVGPAAPASKASATPAAAH